MLLVNGVFNGATLYFYLVCTIVSLYLQPISSSYHCCWWWPGWRPFLRKSWWGLYSGSPFQDPGIHTWSSYSSIRWSCVCRSERGMRAIRSWRRCRSAHAHNHRGYRWLGSGWTRPPLRMGPRSMCCSRAPTGEGHPNLRNGSDTLVHSPWKDLLYICIHLLTLTARLQWKFKIFT